MNTEKPRLESKTIAFNGLKGAFGVFLKDLRALPDDAYQKSFGPSTRTVADLVYEVNLVNDHIGMVIRGEEPFVWPDGGWIKAPEGFGTKEVVIEAFEKSSQKILETIDGYSSDDMEAPLQTDEGETNRFERCRFMILHVWYHSGQLNYIQTLLGDEVWHWQS
jgi:DinB family protein